MTFQRLPQVPPMELPEDLKEMFAQMEAQGWNPQFCDTPVPYFNAGIPCGNPRDVYEATPDGYILVPRSLVGNDATVIARVTGDSMKDAGIEHDDLLHILLDAPVHDGDVVVACIDGECTVKSYYKDADGAVWLVPRNDRYMPLRITEDMNAHIVGRVISHRKPAPRASFSEMQRIVNSAIAHSVAPRTYSPDDIGAILRQAIGNTMEAASDWVAVYRLLVERCGAPSTHTSFARWVNALKPDEYPSCTRDHLRKADGIYFRPLYEWDTHQLQTDALKRRTAIAKRLKQLLA